MAHGRYEPDEKITLLFDPEQKKVGCVLIQAAYGFDSSIISQLFDPSTWELSLGVKFYRATFTYDEWKQIAEAWNERHSARTTRSATE